MVLALVGDSTITNFISISFLFLVLLAVVIAMSILKQF